MRVEWYGQSAFRLDDGERSVFIDPFGDMAGAKERGLTWDYPAIEADADLLLITHEHADHNEVEAISGDPVVLRATAGKHESPVGDVIGVASEHDDAAGSERGPNTIFVFELGGLRVAHLGDFGQGALRDEQAAAIGDVDLLFVPAGGGPTIDGKAAAAIAERLGARWAVPMHYRTERISFLDPVDDFAERLPGSERLENPWFETGDLESSDGPHAVIPAAP
jgi:L-ascorbate metabolism protein UlaG (beta-lactamase superfamily)